MFKNIYVKYLTGIMVAIPNVHIGNFLNSFMVRNCYLSKLIIAQVFVKPQIDTVKRGRISPEKREKNLPRCKAKRLIERKKKLLEMN